MPVFDLHEKVIAQVVDEYIDSRGHLDWPISTLHALRAIKTVLPKCAYSDRELVDLVAASAVRKGRNISFDSAAEIAPVHSADTCSSDHVADV